MNVNTIFSKSILTSKIDLAYLELLSEKKSLCCSVKRAMVKNIKKRKKII